MKNNRNQGGGEDSGRKTIELWWRWWCRENKRNVVEVVDGKQ